MAEITNICFCCKADHDIYDVFDTYICEGIVEIYSEMLTQCFDIEISTDARLKWMCETCLSKLRDAHYFKIKVLSAKEELDTPIEIQLELIESDPDTGAIDEYNNCNIETELDPGTGQIRYVVKRQCIEDNVSSVNAPKHNQEVIETQRRLENINTDAKKETKKLRATKKLFTVEPGDKQCRICDARFNTTKILSEHMNVHYPNHVCEQCSKRFACEGRLRRHMSTHLEGPFPCMICGQVFSKINSRNAHTWRVHQTAEPYTCTDCGERFKTFHSRLKHLQQAHGRTEPQYHCPYCEKKYFYAGARRSHIRETHLRVRNNKCAHCSRAFFKRRSLLSHMATAHCIGDRNHRCPVCHKTFYISTGLRLHMKTHDKDEKRFTCSICDTGFIYKTVLKNHKKFHEEFDINKIQYSTNILKLMN